jgi:hypothetical protein
MRFILIVLFSLTSLVASDWKPLEPKMTMPEYLKTYRTRENPLDITDHNQTFIRVDLHIVNRDIVGLKAELAKNPKALSATDARLYGRDEKKEVWQYNGWFMLGMFGSLESIKLAQTFDPGGWKTANTMASETPAIYCAGRWYQLDVLKWFHAQGATLTECDNRGYTVYDHAMHNDRPDLGPDYLLPKDTNAKEWAVVKWMRSQGITNTRVEKDATEKAQPPRSPANGSKPRTR